MKKILKTITAFVLVAGAISAASAQTRPANSAAAPAKPATPPPASATNAPVPDTKIALVDTSLFAEEKTGITRYLNAVKKVQAEFQPKQTELTGLQTRLKTIADEITKLGAAPVVSNETIQAKRQEGERLQREFKYKKEQADADFEKRYTEVVGPISSDIGKALEQYALQRGITMVLDVTKLLPALITANPNTDITRAFIADYNSKNP